MLPGEETLRTYAIIVAAFFTISIAYAIRYGYGMLLPGMLEQLSMAKTEAGLVSAAYFTAYTLGSPLVGLLADRASSRLLLTVFPVILGLGTLLMAMVDTIAQAALAFALAGLGHSACWAPVVSLVQRWVQDRYRGTALSIATMGGGIGIAVWAWWLPLVIRESSYRQGWLQMGSFALLVAMLNCMLIRNPPAPQHSGQDSAARRGPSYWRLLADARLWLVGTAYAGVGFTVLIPFTFLGVYAVEELQFDHGSATHLFSLIACAGLAGKLLLGVLSDTLSRLLVLISCSLLLGGGCLAIPLASTPWQLSGASVLFGLGFGAVWPVYAAAAMDFFPREVAGSVIGLWTLFLGVGSITAPVMAGWVIDRTGSGSWAFGLGGAVALVTVLCLLPLYRPRKADAVESVCQATRSAG